MSVTISGAQDALVPDRRLAASEPAAWPRLLPGTELIGQAAGSGLREPPYLVRRRDGQLVQLSQLLYMLVSHMDGRELAAIADGAGALLDLRITPEQVAYIAEHKLTPLGLVVGRDGSEPRLERRTALLALKFRAGIVPEAAVNALAEVLRVLFWLPVVIAALSALLACDVWLGTSHGTGAGMRVIIRTPALGLALLAFVLLAAAFHECGHAAACRYGGARPGRIGIGIYLIWPVFYTDVTDSYRLAKAGRVRTDLGGVYFNALFALAAAATYFLTGFEPLLVLVVTQQILILDQFLPWVRLDGYYVVSDLVGIPDLFARIRPVIASLVPGRDPGPRVIELKPWVRVAVTSWVLTTVAALTAIAALIIVNAPSYLIRAWQSLILQLHWVGHSVRIGSVVDFLSGVISIFTLVMPIAGITLLLLLLCRRVAALARRHARASHARAKLALAGANGENALPARSDNNLFVHERSPEERARLKSISKRAKYQSKRQGTMIPLASSTGMPAPQNDVPSDAGGGARRPVRVRAEHALPARASLPASLRGAFAALSPSWNTRDAETLDVSDPELFTRAARQPARVRVRKAWLGSDYERLLEASALMPYAPRCQTIAVISPKGGVGKTAITALLGSLIAFIRHDRTIAVDTNPDLGSLGRRLVPDHRVFIDDLLAGPLASERTSPMDLAVHLGRGPDGLKVAPAPTDRERAQFLDETAYRTLFAKLSGLAEVLVLDCGTGLHSPAACAALAAADQLVLVCDGEPDTASLICDRACKSLLEGLRVPVFLVANKLTSRCRIDLGTFEREMSFAAGIVEVPHDQAGADSLQRSRFSWAHRAPKSWRVPLRELAALIAMSWTVEAPGDGRVGAGGA